jgi:hypothetical protein
VRIIIKYYILHIKNIMKNDLPLDYSRGSLHYPSANKGNDSDTPRRECNDRV